MEISRKHDTYPTSLHRASAMRSFVKLFLVVALGLGTLGTEHLTSSRDDHQRNLRIQSSPSMSSSDFERMLQATEPPSCDLDCCTSEFKDTICQTSNENSWVKKIPFPVQILLIIFLISGSALFSGLTLGLMSLDKTGLEIVMAGDNPKAASYARRIYPIRDDGNLLLCTLLLGNVSVNSLLSILMADYAGGIVGFISSTFLIVIFGEIIPQAACSRHALRIGSLTIPIVRVVVVIFYPVAKPLALALDLALGRELATIYSHAEITKLLQIHVQENAIDPETAGAMTGALTYKNVTVKEVMTPIDKTFMLNVDDKLSFQTIAKIFKTGFSRIPVFEISKDNVIGLLFVKDLIFVDPEDEIPIRSFVQIFGRNVHVVWPDDTLGDVLAELKGGRSHLALVRDVNNLDESQDPFYEIKGIITMEDIIEKILGDSIVDETDAFVDKNQLVKVARAESFEWARLRLLDTKIVDQMLSASEVKAVTAHLRMNYPDTVQLLTDSQLTRLVSTTAVTNREAATHQLGNDLPDELLYTKGEPCDFCTLVLSGKVTILVGAENFRSELSAWSVLGKTALENSNFVPDFTAFVSDGPCRCLHFTRSAFAAAVDASAVERTKSEIKAASIRYMEDGSYTGDNLSTTSSDVPNRREKIIARLFNKKGNEDGGDKGSVFQAEKKPMVRFEPNLGTAGEEETGGQGETIDDEHECDENDNTRKSKKGRQTKKKIGKEDTVSKDPGVVGNMEDRDDRAQKVSNISSINGAPRDKGGADSSMDDPGDKRIETDGTSLLPLGRKVKDEDDINSLEEA